MRRLLASAALVALVAAACSSSEPSEVPAAALAEVVISGGQNAVTHGGDSLPPKPPSLFAQTAPEASWPCEGNGQTGRRAQMLYVHAGNGDLASLRPSIETWTRQIEGIFLSSSRESGGERLLRFATGPDCSLSIIEAVVSSDALSSFDRMITELRNQGHARNDRLYHSWVDARSYCGIGTVYEDDRPAGNTNDVNAQYSRTDRPCWNSNVAAHELGHNIGMVQNSAPNSSGGLHTRDEHDNMSYPDGAPKGQMFTACPDPVGEDRFDCNHDDYFAAVPTPGSYLATHWNAADSSALVRGAVSTTTPPAVEHDEHHRPAHDVYQRRQG